MAEVFNRSTSLWWNYGNLGQWCPNAQGAPQCGAVITCTPRSDRFISLRLSARPHDVVITQSYNPISTMWRIFLCICFFILRSLMLDNPRFYLQSVTWFISALWSPLACTHHYHLRWANSPFLMVIADVVDIGWLLIAVHLVLFDHLYQSEH